MHSITLVTVLIFGIVIGSTEAQYNGTYSTIQPVLAEDFADPSLVNVNGTWFAFATSGNGHNIQVAASPSFTTHEWRLLNETNVLPDPGPWALNKDIWAPDVVQLEDGRWVMYYAAPLVDNKDMHCIGAATSTSIVGPYEPQKDPFACPKEDGGAIDASGFVDPKSGNLYVVYKVDGNSINAHGGDCNGNPDPSNGYLHPTPIMLQQVSKADGITKMGDPVQLLDRGEADGPLVEAPSLFYNSESGLYFLTFSSNCYATDLYDIGFAYSSCLDTEFVKSKYPLMTTQSIGVSAPGGADMSDDGKYALYHATVDKTENGSPIRYMYAAEADQAGLDVSAIPLV
ncbi:hypothetical protein PMZ80_006482 [Knufia obscura]|uniref:Glycoside hydrolase family 43 protein n=2 Tax=Knufia TaxID=430999 RepID=A0AAN8EVW9_9EURO|nr:hypothetical protein PMZ80_006482 [Knufia obscura]KAK5953368.1 hypothetical protein OHC33_005312 [Knufia fluminis]